MRGKTLLFQYRRQIRRTGAGVVEEGRRVGYSDDLPAAWTNFKGEPGVLYWQISDLEQL